VFECVSVFFVFFVCLGTSRMSLNYSAWIFGNLNFFFVFDFFFIQNFFFLGINKVS
jgi:hypothetical protein